MLTDSMVYFLHPSLILSPTRGNKILNLGIISKRENLIFKIGIIMLIEDLISQIGDNIAQWGYFLLVVLEGLLPTRLPPPALTGPVWPGAVKKLNHTKWCW